MSKPKTGVVVNGIVEEQYDKKVYSDSVSGSIEGLITFYSDRDGSPEIYIMQAAGGEALRLTDGPAFDDSPALSPDGAQIVFLMARNDLNPRFSDLKYEICVMDSDGGNPRRLTNTGATEDHPAWSPDGNKIIFDADYDGDGYYEIYTMNPDGTAVTRLTFNQANDQFTDWSPDGTQIAFSIDPVHQPFAEIPAIRQNHE